MQKLTRDNRTKASEKSNYSELSNISNKDKKVIEKPPIFDASKWKQEVEYITKILIKTTSLPW